MDLKEKASYILGLIEGSKLDMSKEENRIIKNISELLREVSSKVDELSNVCSENSALIDEIDEDLANLESHSCGHGVGKKCKDMSSEKNCDCSEVDVSEGREDFLNNGSYEFGCPNCGRAVVLDDEIFEKEDILCPECGEKIEFDFKNVEEE